MNDAILTDTSCAAAGAHNLDCMCEACLLDALIDDSLARKTMPRGALGQFGDLARQIARIQKSLAPSVERSAVIVFAADHGVSAQGVSAYPREVTWQMVENFRSGGAAINVLTRAHDIALYVVDAGVDHDFAPPPGNRGTFEARSQFLSRKVGYGTADFSVGPAMTMAQAQTCLDLGAGVLETVVQETACQAVGFGEMGIANTTSAAAIICRVLGLSPGEVVGRGTGIDEATLSIKHNVVQRTLALHAMAKSPLEILSAFGGFEIGQMAGAMLAAARAGQVVVVDGFISCAAFLIAQAMSPDLLKSSVFAHQSGERGAALVLRALGVHPVLDLGLRLGEGSGAAMVMPLLKSAAAILRDMASFESAGVADASARSEV